MADGQALPGGDRAAAPAASSSSSSCPSAPLHGSHLLCGACAGASHDPFRPPPSPPVYRPIRSPAINAPNHSKAAIVLSPVPQPQPVPLLHPPHEFLPPGKKISTPDDIALFQSSSSGQNFVGFIAALSQSVVRKKISDPVPESPALASLLALLRAISSWVVEIPRSPHPGRYGNPAFRIWHQRLQERAHELVLGLLPDSAFKSGAAAELTPYLLDSFGNSTRIDYGTGHETNFAAFLYCLARLGFLREEDYPGLVLRVFVKYLELMRNLQLVYSLEPAGSHGVWGLDDYHFLPFIFGSAQLVDHKYMKPKSIHNEDIVESFSGDYMYLACIGFVKKVKKGLFSEHSPMLDDISGVPTWSKVNSGMLKMYKAEVLEKVPIMQHFLFGSIIKWEENRNS
ncbi:phosphotyrosyl phosphatase activator (PTPA) family protein [Wolffia australiana]